MVSQILWPLTSGGLSKILFCTGAGIIRSMVIKAISQVFVQQWGKLTFPVLIRVVPMALMMVNLQILISHHLNRQFEIK